MGESSFTGSDGGGDCFAREKYATQFIAAACVASDRGWEHSATANGWTAVLLTHRMRLPLQDNVEYFKDWAVFAAYSLTEDESLLGGRSIDVDLQVIEDRFEDHLRGAIGSGIPATGPISKVIGPAVTRGWCDRDETVELVFAGLDAAVRPADRKAWFSILVDDLGVSDDEFLSRAEALVQTMSLGDSVVIEKISPILIARGDEHSLTEVLTVALLAKPKKTRRLVLFAAADRPRPDDEVVAAVSYLVMELAAGDDLALARAANRLMAAWQIEGEPLPEPDAEIRGLWQTAPDPWDVPRFVTGEATGESVRDLGAQLFARRSEGVDTVVEQFLAQLAALAYRDPAAARSALAGMPAVWQAGLFGATSWAQEPVDQTNSESVADSEITDDDPEFAALLELQSQWSYVADPVWARDQALATAFGDAPVLLSTPSWVDLRLDVADLVDRLETYQRSSATATESDLFLALTRLDTAGMTSETHTALKQITVPVKLEDGTTMTRTAGEIVAEYVQDPVQEPDLVVDTRLGGWDVDEITVPSSLREFPNRLADRVTPVQYFVVFPTWRRAATRMLDWISEAGRGVALRQLARAAQPFDGPTAINFLAAQSSLHDAAAADASIAIQEAWQRGLLRPGTADVCYLNWQRTPSGLTAFAATSAELANKGLLSVVWPVFDDLIVESLCAPRTLAGTIDIVRVIKSFMAEVTTAVAAGVAGTTALDLPGLRELAGRGGSGNAVRLAKEIVAELPEPVAVAPIREPEPAVDLDGIWPAKAGTAPAVIDDVSIEAHWLDATAVRKRLVLDLRLPGDADRVLRVDKSWFYDLEVERQCAADVLGDSGDTAQVWLRWDVRRRRLVVGEHRNWSGEGEGPLVRDAQIGPLTVTMVAVVLATLCHDDPASHYYVQSILRSGDVGWQAVRAAMRTLLSHPDVSPARMVKIVEKNPDLLAVMWPVLTESVRTAASGEGNPPKWLNRVLDTALYYVSYLREAARLGRIPVDDAQWSGLVELAARPGKSAAIGKAAALRDALGIVH